MNDAKALQKLDRKLERAASRRPLRTVALNFALLTLIVLASMAYFSLSEATIVITSPQEEYMLNEKVEMGIGKDIPGTVQKQEFSDASSFQASAQSTTSASSLSFITIVNTSNKEQQLRATTRFLTNDNILYRLKEFRAVPPQGHVDAEVTPDKAGSRSLQNGETLTLPALWPGLQDKIYGKAIDTPSVTKTRYVLSDDDVARAKEALSAKLLDKAFESLHATMPNLTKENIVPGTLTFSSDKKVGDETQTFTMEVKGTIQTFTYSTDDVEKFMAAKAMLSVPDGKEYDSLKKNTLRTTPLSYDTETQVGTLRVSATALFNLASLAPVIDKNQIAGLPKDKAIAKIQAMLPHTTIQVRFWPFWVRTIPTLTDHIRIRINE